MQAFKASVILIVLGLIGSLVVACGSGIVRDPKIVKVGQDVTVGQAAWKVLSVEKTKQLGGQTGGGMTAEGTFVVIELQVKNTAGEAVNVTGVEVEIADADNNKYTFDSQNNASLLAAANKENFVQGSIMPNQTASGWIIFDVPEAAEGLKLRVNDLDITSHKYALVELGV